MEYPLVEAGITNKDALNLCWEYGFDFGDIYSHHKHFNCWCCPLQNKNELRWLFKNKPKLWDYLRKMQMETDGYYRAGKTIFEYDKLFWEENLEKLREKRLYNRKRDEKNES